MSDRVQAIASAVVLVATLVLIGTAGGTSAAPGAELRPVPRCPEDSVLIGRGSFEAGRWSAYGCGPAVDDYAP